MATLQEVYYSKPGASCGACGTPIHNCYVVATETGTITIGSECAKRLLSTSHATQIERWFSASAREWRKQVPSPRDGEVRADYITRRVREKGVALLAWEAWRAMQTQGEFGRSHRNTAIKRLAQRDVRNPYWPSRSHTNLHGYVWRDGCRVCEDFKAEIAAYQQAINDELEAMVREVEQRYNANRADFLNMPTWRVA